MLKVSNQRMGRMTEITANWLHLHSLSLPPPQKNTIHITTNKYKHVFLVNWHAQVATDGTNFQENCPWSMHSMKPSTNLYSSISLFHITTINKFWWSNQFCYERPFANSEICFKISDKWGMRLVIAEAFQSAYKCAIPAE